VPSIVVEKPYQFVPPHHGNTWPNWIQRLRFVDRYLRRSEGVVDYECRHLDRLRESLAAGHGILLAPNHCRYADPLALGWLGRHTPTHVYAMASWHLFNKHWFDTFAIPKMGGFSVYREGLDRQSIETAIDCLVAANRPLVIFPEGATYRTNDQLQPLLDGVTFIARSAARRRSKEGRQVVIQPIGLKYVFQGDVEASADAALRRLESRLSWQPQRHLTLLERVKRVGEGLLALKEVEYLGMPQAGPITTRQQMLIDHLIGTLEQQWLGGMARARELSGVLPRVKNLRMKIVPEMLALPAESRQRQELREQLQRLELAQQLASYPPDYLRAAPVTETRVLETLERMQEDLLEGVLWPGPLRVIIEVGEAIPVPADRVPREGEDPLLGALRNALTEMLGRLQYEARLLEV